MSATDLRDPVASHVMATFKTRWLLPMLFLHLPNCFTLGGCPAHLPAPDCYIPCDENYCIGDVYCSWKQMQTSQIPTNYSLHWRTIHSNEKITRTNFNGLIPRDHFSHPAELFVWVQAKYKHGCAKSDGVTFNTTDIIKPPPPKFSDLSDDEAFEIHWHSFCDQLMKLVGFCDVRYRTDTDPTWIEEKGFYSSYTVENPEKCTAYELQVRCACKTSLASNWSASRRIPGSEMAPIGKLDIWMDCDVTKASDCILTWKKLPISQSCGVILGYELRLVHTDSTVVLVNLSMSLPMNQLECDEMQCHFTSSIKNATSVSLSAYNVHGATTPSYLPKLVKGNRETQQVLQLKMNFKNLMVSWNVPPQLSDGLKEYVVEYKQAGSPLGQAFDWVKLNKSQTTAFFRGHFNEYTAYLVSLYTVSHENEVHQLSSAIAYSQQRAPSIIPSFKVMSIETTSVKLCWEPFPLSKQEGLVLLYQIGVDQNVKVYNRSSLPLDENTTEMMLQHLSPGQEYEVWIRAVTAVGPGEKTTLRFKTKYHEYFDYWKVFGIVCFFCFFVVICLLARKKKLCPLLYGCYFERVPDPKNSYIFRETKYQIHEPMTWICSPSKESFPKIIVLEVVLIQPNLEKNDNADKLNTQMVGGQSSLMESEEDRRVDAVREECHRSGAYKKMVDSDEESRWSSSEEEPCTSGYEKHFMPTTAEVLEGS